MRRKLKDLRIKKGYQTQKEFSEKLGISEKTYGHIERGYSFPREPLMKLIMEVLETTDILIFENDSKNHRGDVSKQICNYMNKLRKNDEEYTVDIINAIRSALKHELNDRKEKSIDIKSNSLKGKWQIYKRVANIAKDIFEIEINAEDVQLFKSCTRLEYENRTGKTTWGIPKERKRLGCNPVSGYQGKRLRLKRHG